MTLQDKVIAIIAEQAMLDPSDITPDSTLDELGIDSMGVVESIFTFEETFDITVPFDANNPGDSDFDISTVATITQSLETLIAAQAQQG